jgi:SPP1 family predicted phage head-tail adaptor
MIRAGTMDRQIMLTAAPGGQAVPVWAKIAEISGREMWEANQLTMERTATFLIRFRTGLDETSTIEWDGQTWSVISWKQVGRREGLELTARARR